MVATAASAVPAWIPRTCPAALKSTGMTFEMPRPTSPHPTTAAAGAPTRSGAAEPAGGHRPRCAEHPAGPEQADQAVAAEAARGHGERERGEAGGRDRRGRLERVAQVDGAPVGHRALRQQAEEGEDAEAEEHAARPGEDGGGARVGGI